ncbi:hypothetical protein Bca4012_021209 [Brassica carinata]
MSTRHKKPISRNFYVHKVPMTITVAPPPNCGCWGLGGKICDQISLRLSTSAQSSVLFPTTREEVPRPNLD